MKTVRAVRAVDPLTTEQVDAWAARSSTIRDRVTDTTTTTTEVVVFNVEPERLRTSVRAQFVLTVLVVAALIGGLLIANGWRDQSVQSVSTAGAVMDRVPVELSIGGYIWLSPSGMTVDDAAAEFAFQAVGWTEPRVVPRTNEFGPTWVDVTNNAETMRLLFVPDSDAGDQWRLMQVGTVPVISQTDQQGQTQLHLDGVPSDALSAVVLVASDAGTRIVEIDTVDGNTTVDIGGPAPSVLVFFFDAQGAVVSAIGAHT